MDHTRGSGTPVLQREVLITRSARWTTRASERLAQFSTQHRCSPQFMPSEGRVYFTRDLLHVPIPKSHHCAAHSFANSEIKRCRNHDSSAVLDLKFLHKRAAIMIGTQIHRTRRSHGKPSISFSLTRRAEPVMKRMGGTSPSVPIPKFASLCCTLVCERRN